MKARSIFVAVFFLAVMPFSTVAQPARKGVDVEPPQLHKSLASANGQTNDALAGVLAVKPEIPLGPVDVLKEYESEMTLIAQRISAELADISQAVRSNQIARDQAEYLIQERYQVAMMQHQVLSALHDALEHDVAQTGAVAKRLGRAGESDTAVVVEMPSSGSSATQ